MTPCNFTGDAALYPDIYPDLTAEALSRKLAELEGNEIVQTTERKRIDDCPEIIGTSGQVGHLITHLTFLHQDTCRHDELTPKQLTAYAASEYGVLLGNLRAALVQFNPKPPTDGNIGSIIDWTVAEQLGERGFIVAYDQRDRTLAVQVGNSALVLHGVNRTGDFVG